MSDKIACVIIKIRLAHNCPCQQSFMNGGGAHTTLPITDELLNHGLLQFILIVLGSVLSACMSVKRKYVL